MPRKECLDCRGLFTGAGARCPRCGNARQRARDARRGTTAQRGYGSQHQQLRAELLADLAAHPGQPCPRCGRPMYAGQNPDLDHTDDRSGYRGLSHSDCNRGHATG